MFYSDLMHGVNVVNLFDFRNTHGTTENSVQPGYGMYEAVLQGVWEAGSFEDLLFAGVLQGQPMGSKVGLFMSSAADAWRETDMNGYAAAVRALYIVLRHFEWHVSIIVEEDVTDAVYMAGFAAVFLADMHMTTASAFGVESWLRTAGFSLIPGRHKFGFPVFHQLGVALGVLTVSQSNG